MNKKLVFTLTTIILTIIITICIGLNILNNNNEIIINQKIQSHSKTIVNNDDNTETISYQEDNENTDENNSNTDVITNDIIDNNIVYQNTNNTFNQVNTREVLDLVNQIRIDNELSPLIWNSSLEQSAMIRANEITNTFEHVRPDGTSCFDTINIPYVYAGENIASGQSNSQMVVDDWMASISHSENILDPDFTEMGVALYYDSSSEYEYYWVQLFIGK